MTPARFRECLRTIRWTSIDLVNALHCDLAWIESIESGEIPIPEDMATWLEKIASYHLENQPPITCRVQTVFPKPYAPVAQKEIRRAS